ncbi:menaquinone-dependent protoporphyrinogen IX dehydrogenase [Salinimicrobium tongyeongense]|uniref:Protoporphyrinogen IX dehydrogenase [quinone] n=1 Tax=Salinimicrobium tongyeongense TaxID=2809707 RepID=A0ABY6NV97_9FLAO|nr:menaquinone-dependent protoporphyrinogen IX dehydrogenase [Salinimicrobium tongyeongense]
MKPIALLYSTVDGQTKKICQYIAEYLNRKNQPVELCPIDSFKEKISRFETLVIGASIRYGKHKPGVGKLITENRQELEKLNVVFFSVNLVARKDDKNTPDTNPYLIKFLQEINWQPDLAAVFAGSLDYKKYGFFDRLMIRAIMKFTGGPTKTPEPIEYTNWKRVEEFAEELYSLHEKSKAEITEKAPA